MAEADLDVTGRAALEAFLVRHAPFDQMTPADLDWMIEQGRIVRYAKGDRVTDPARGPVQSFHILTEGLVVGAEQGEDEALSGNAWELVPGECFPVGALLAGRPVRNAQIVAEDAACLELPAEAFATLRRRSEAFDRFCTGRMASLLEKSRQQVQASAVRDLVGDTALNVRLADRRLRRPVTAPPEQTVRAVLETMSAERIGSMVVVDAADRPIGIFTLKDLMNRVALTGAGLDGPIAAVMTRDPVTVPRTAFAFEAAMKMAERGIHHICVVEDGRLVGVVSERDLFSMQRVGLVALSRAIDRAASIAEVARYTADIHALVGQMMAQGVKVGQITQMISLLNDHVSNRVIGLCLDEVALPEGLEFAWLAFGSEGRMEQTLKTDQDNGILFRPPDGLDADAARAALLPLAARINDALADCGFPLCPGNVMARNPDCCLSAAEWEARFRRWIDQGTPEHLLNASIYFDFRVIRGDEAAARQLRDGLSQRARANSRFRRQMAANALENGPPLGLFQRFRLTGTGSQAGTIDLKANGVTPFIDAARIMALGAGIGDTNTVTRLERSGAAGPADIAAWVDAYNYIRLLRLRLNQEQAAAGRPLTNRVAPESLNDLDRRILKEAFREAQGLQAKIRLDYQL